MVPEPSQAESSVWPRPDPLPPPEHDPAEPDPAENEAEPTPAEDEAEPAPAEHEVEPAPTEHEVEPAPTDPPVHSLKRWILLAVLVVVWIPAAAAGVGLYYWWFHSVDKRWPVFVVLVFVGVCTVCALLAAMVNDKPLVSALALAVMAAPLAAFTAAAVLHGTYFCARSGHCLVGLIPY